LHIGDDSHYTNNIDTVIEFLKTPQPQKYKVGDFVWVRQDNNKPEHKKIIWIIFEDGEWRYGIASAATGFEYTVTENELFLDKKSLINAQIKYWVGFKNKENKQC
jgi:hypothetical protein